MDLVHVVQCLTALEFHARGDVLADKMQSEIHLELLVGRHALEIDMHDVAARRVPLKVLYDGVNHFLRA